MEAIKARRSIRKYKPDPLPEEALQTVLEAVRWAPSWANTQCWKVIVVKDPKIKSELAATLPKGNPALSSMSDASIGDIGSERVAEALIRRDEKRNIYRKICLDKKGIIIGAILINQVDDLGSPRR